MPEELHGRVFEGRSGEMRDSPWLASEDLLDVDADVEVEIEQVFFHKQATFAQGRKADVFSLKFAGKAKEMVLNNTNRKRLVALFGTPDTRKWRGKKIGLYVDRKVRLPDGTTGMGLRIRV